MCHTITDGDRPAFRAHRMRSIFIDRADPPASRRAMYTPEDTERPASSLPSQTMEWLPADRRPETSVRTMRPMMSYTVSPAFAAEGRENEMAVEGLKGLGLFGNRTTARGVLVSCRTSSAPEKEY